VHWLTVFKHNRRYADIFRRLLVWRYLRIFWFVNLLLMTGRCLIAHFILGKNLNRCYNFRYRFGRFHRWDTRFWSKFGLSKMIRRVPAFVHFPLSSYPTAKPLLPALEKHDCAQNVELRSGKCSIVRLSDICIICYIADCFFFKPHNSIFYFLFFTCAL